MNPLAEHRRSVGLANRVSVLCWFRDHPGGTNRECAKALGLSEMAVGRHAKAIRQTWPTDPAPGGTRQSTESSNMDTEQKGTVYTYGQKAVGLTFNPSGDDAVAKCKAIFGHAIDQMNDFRNAPGTTPEAKRLASIAITEAQGAQMWAVKALTWRD